MMNLLSCVALPSKSTAGAMLDCGCGSVRSRTGKWVHYSPPHLKCCSHARYECNPAATTFLDPHEIALIHEQRKQLHFQNDGLLICGQISLWVRRIRPDLRYVVGSISDYNDGPPFDHAWLMTTEGLILDCAADQLGRPGICLFGPNDPEYRFYKLERTVPPV